MAKLTRMNIFLIHMFQSIYVISEFVDGAIVLRPADLIVLAGQQARFECRTNESFPLAWYFQSILPWRSEDIYSMRFFTDDMKDRYTMNITHNDTQFTLGIEVTNEWHAGTYTCKDRDGFGETAPADLIILNSEPECSYTEKNSATMVGRCNVSTVGDILPQMQCNSHIYDTQLRDGQIHFEINIIAAENATCELCFKLQQDRCIVWNVTILDRTDLESESDRQTSDGSPGTRSDIKLAIILSSLLIFIAIVVTIVITFIFIHLKRKKKRELKRHGHSNGVPTPESKTMNHNYQRAEMADE